MSAVHFLCDVGALRFFLAGEARGKRDRSSLAASYWNFSRKLVLILHRSGGSEYATRTSRLISLLAARALVSSATLIVLHTYIHLNAIPFTFLVLKWWCSCIKCSDKIRQCKLCLRQFVLRDIQKYYFLIYIHFKIVYMTNISAWITVIDKVLC